MKRLKLSAEGRLRASVQVALAFGATSVALGGTAFAADAEAPATQLEKVQVTGSRIRSVDIQTSNPVFTLSRDQITATGATTLGDLLQSIPAATGVVTNPQVNNGGGNGGASVNLRGVGAERTLVLLDGRRVIGTTFSDISYVDLNTLPINMVERIEVLKEGASTIYGSDAIGGVINIITRSRFNDGELQFIYGRTQHNDGTHKNVNATIGAGSSSGHAVVGLEYDRQGIIKAKDRTLTSLPTAFYYTALDPNAGTSGRVPTGRYTVDGFTPAPNAHDTDCPTPLLFNGVTRIEGHTGTSTSDFRNFCSNSGPGYTDRYNFLPDNLLLTPARRFAGFLLGEHDLFSTGIVSGVKGYLEGFITHTVSNNQLAAEPIDNGTVQSVIGPTIISKDNIYNPFGVDIAKYALRPTLVGDRIETVSTSTYQGTLGIKGMLDRFDWDAAYTYGRIDQSESDYGFLNFSNLQNELGASYYTDAQGNVLNVAKGAVPPAGAIAHCGTPGSPPINQCTPVNMFGTEGNTVAALGTTANTNTEQDQSQFLATIGGEIINLPAGPLGASLGYEYRKYNFNRIPDGLEQAFLLSENNSKATHGSYDVREWFAEFRIPLLANLPGVESLLIAPGVRFSNYSTFHNTVNSKIGLEYRPYEDLKLRATFADVFRSPTVNDLFRGNLQDAPGYTDPCTKYGSAANPVTPNGDLACEHVTPNGTFKATNTQATAVRIANPDLKPEKGFTTDFGFVFNPSFYRPLTVEADYFKYNIRNDIGLLTTNTSVNTCFTTGQLCSLTIGGQNFDLVGRGDDGQLTNSIEPTVNAGVLTVQGFDFGFRLSYPKTPVGGFVITVDTTYLQKWDTTTEFQGLLLDRESLAGQTDGGVNGTFPRWKSFATLSWNLGPFSAQLRDRFLGTVGEGGQTFNGSPDVAIDVGDTGTCNGSEDTAVNKFGVEVLCRRSVGVANYVDGSFSYDVKPIQAKFTVGITDIFNQGGKFVASAAAGGLGTGYPTDPATYDITGRAFFASVKFDYK